MIVNLRIKWTNGAVYTGEVKNGFRNGYGELTCKEYTYKGSFYKSGKYLKGLKNGKGLLTFVNGETYEGYFK